MKRVDTAIDIHAPARTVWEVLTDFSSYADWNPYIVSIDGDLTAGSVITAKTRTPELGDRDLKARMSSVGFPELAWAVQLPVPGLIRGRHSFRVEASDSDTSRFIQSEEVSGLLTGFFFHLVEKSESGFAAMNQAIKERAEARHAVPGLRGRS